MIRNDEISITATRTSNYLLRHIMAGVDVDSEVLRHIAAGIESFLETLPTGSSFSEEALAWIAAQALVACGEDSAAAQLMRQCTLIPREEAVLDLLRHRWGFLPSAWRLFSTGLVSVAPCDFEGGRAVWVLDFGHLAVDGHCFELSWVPAVRRLLETVVALWQRSGVPTALGIKGVQRFALRLGEKRSVRRWMPWMVGMFEALLAAAVRCHGGSRIPRIVVMDDYSVRRGQRRSGRGVSTRN